MSCREYSSILQATSFTVQINLEKQKVNQLIVMRAIVLRIRIDEKLN